MLKPTAHTDHRGIVSLSVELFPPADTWPTTLHDVFNHYLSCLERLEAYL